MAAKTKLQQAQFRKFSNLGTLRRSEVSIKILLNQYYPAGSYMLDEFNNMIAELEHAIKKEYTKVYNSAEKL